MPDCPCGGPLRGHQESSLPGAIAAFNALWDEYYGLGDTSLMEGPKTAGNAALALSQYIRQYQGCDLVPINVEIPSEVPVTDSESLVLRLDLLVRDPTVNK